MGRIRQALGLEKRAQTGEKRSQTGEAEDALLKALLGEETVTRDMAMQVPTISGGIDLIGALVAGTPIKLYSERDGRAREISGDDRLRLLNDETGDTLNANDFWRAMVRDYYLGKGGYAYIDRSGGRVSGLYYVDERKISILRNSDPIRKEYDIMVDGSRYLPHSFLRVLRNTADGMEGMPITRESSTLIATAMQSMQFELDLVKKGGNKRGFLQSAKHLDRDAMTTLRDAFRSMYSGRTDNVVVLNDGVTFRESSATSVEMQLNEQKRANADEFARIFHIPAGMIGGTASQTDIASLARLAAIPLMKAIECALNRDLLLEDEKGRLYFAFDTRELLKGDMAARFAAYKTALDANFMGIDEVRFAEDLEPLGLTWIKLGLNDVLYDPKTQRIYTPNTNQTAQMGGQGLPTGGAGAILDERAQTRRPNGQFGESDGTGGTGKGSSGRRRKGALSAKERSAVAHGFMTDFPRAKAGSSTMYDYGNYTYHVKVKDVGEYDISRYKKLK